MRVGSGSPTLMSLVLSLKSLQNCAMLTFLCSITDRYSEARHSQSLATLLETIVNNVNLPSGLHKLKCACTLQYNLLGLL